MLNAKQAMLVAEKQVETAFAVFESKSLRLHGSPIRTQRLGDLILSGVKRASATPSESLAVLEAELKVTLKKALQPIADVEAEIATLEHVANFLQNGGALHVEDTQTTAAAKAVRAAHLLGTLDAVAVGQDMLRSVELTKAELARTKQVWVPKIERARQVVEAKARLAVYKSFQMDAEAQKADLRLTRVKAVASWYASPQSKARLTQRQARLASKLGV